jgi:peptide-methionine (S)-S-oxide reductase
MAPQGSMSELGSATLGGGCFWCLEAVYEQLQGVIGVESGYAGGHVQAPTYEAVCSATTGHAEVVQIRFDAAVVGFSDLLEVFFAIHDPTTKDRQGNDVGPQYRSAIFYHDEEQAATARAVIGDLEQESEYDDPIVTEVVPLERFWPAEEYHRQYFERNASQPYCAMVVGPKVSRFRQRFGDRMKGIGPRAS